jgi:type III restriction enzyme
VTDEVLDTVELFLPHYDKETLEEVLKRLRNPDAGEGVPTRAETSATAYPRRPGIEDIFEHLQTLQTYTVNRVPKMAETKRVLRLAGMLVHEGINKDADQEVRNALTAKLRELRDKFAAADPKWGDVVREGGEIDVDVIQVAVGQMTVTDSRSTRLTLTTENIDQLFDAAGRMLASGEGLHRAYWKRYHTKADSNETKLELFAIARQPEGIAALEKAAKEEFDKWLGKHNADIRKLPAAGRARFNVLIQAGGEAAVQNWELPVQIVEKTEGSEWAKHLYCDATGEFSAKLNGWESSLLEAELKKADVVGWLRNMPRRDWALCVPYELGGTRPFYPDFIIVRKSGSGFVVDVLEPHDDSRTDTWAKAKGLAVFADKHGLDYGRLIIARMKKDEWQFVDVNKKATREKARRMQSPNDLESLFA